MAVQPLSLLLGIASLSSLLITANGTLSLNSSLEMKNRKFVCPFEKVIYTCSVSGSVLVWETLNTTNRQCVLQQIRSFSLNDRLGEGFFQPKQVNLYPNDDTLTVIFTGVLTNVNRSVQELSSIMVVESESNDVVSMDCSPLTIICKSEDPQAGAKNKSHSIAVQPILPQASLKCLYHEYRSTFYQACLINVTLNTTDILLNNNSTDISFISVRVRNDSEESHDFPINSTKRVVASNVTFYYNCLVEDQLSISITVTLVDMCDQCSDPRIIKCSMSKDSNAVVLHRAKDRLKLVLTLAMLITPLYIF